MAVEYPRGAKPNFSRPKVEKKAYRFVIGRVKKRGSDPLVVLGMNPSHANLQRSDRTVSRVIRASAELGHDGWVVINLYPVRSSNPAKLGSYDKELSKKNVRAIVKRLKKLGVKRVLGAWGDLKHPTLKRAKADVLKAFKKHGIRVYYFEELTGRGNPRHPNPRGRKWETTGPRRMLRF